MRLGLGFTSVGSADSALCDSAPVVLFRVEQQLMSRMIADMYSQPPPDPAQNDSTDQLELEEQSLTSDIGSLDQTLLALYFRTCAELLMSVWSAVEAAGGEGLQLFVDSNMSVDSALIRQLVNEVLSETVAQMLNRTDAAPEPEVEAAESQRNEETEVKKTPQLSDHPPASV